jgi:hypothetical protein
VLIGFGNGIRRAKRLAASKALSDLDNDISCHARKYDMGSTKFQLQCGNALIKLTHYHCPSGYRESGGYCAPGRRAYIDPFAR